MEKGKIVAKEPRTVSLEKGLYFWCQCGLSEKQPFCDGSHKGSSFVPVKLQIEEEKKVVLCQCRQTNQPPFCDGSHKKL